MRRDFLKVRMQEFCRKIGSENRRIERENEEGAIDMSSILPFSIMGTATILQMKTIQIEKIQPHDHLCFKGHDDSVAEHNFIV